MRRTSLKRILIAAVIVGIIVVFKIFNLGEYFTLSYIKASQQIFEALYSEHKLLVIGSYMLIYILVTSLSLPGAAVMTLAGGGMFGLLLGTVIVSFASTIGATMACFVSRFILRDWLQGKFGDKLKTVNEGIEREGVFYLFTLRLIPVFPFWLINLLMGLTKMPLKTFYLISQVGMLPGTIVYVNAGKELAKIESLSGILSPGLILSFVLLGLFPIITKKLLTFYKTKKSRNT
ncbi:MAG: dihydrolipoamide dehydrogenase [Nitrospira bacterium SM23_35]|nr:MAG: dihydrolipoamide dehydrogenase [Nitrospira bacterium SM23_35]